jgi:GT2 family glycosyltransferase
MGVDLRATPSRVHIDRRPVTTPLVSIVIPTRNGMSTLPALFSAVESQRTDFRVEVVAIDTASTDGTADLLHARATRVLAVPLDAFNHGVTRNQAIESTCGEFIVLLSQDAEPVGPGWLTALVDPLRTCSAVAATYARQSARPDAGAIARHYHSRWAGSSTQPRRSRITAAADFAQLEPLMRMQACTFDNVCSCIRRAVWQQHPFQRTAIAEDLEWAKTVLLAGFDIAYVPEAVVLHSHSRSALYEFRRTALLHQRLHALFEVRTIPTLAALGRALLSTLRLHLQCRRADAAVPRESLARAVALAAAWPAGQYVGGLCGVRGWSLTGARGV